MEIIDYLKDFGLSEKESKIWLICLELGEATAYEIAKKSNLQRSLVYDILERLIEKGLISLIVKNRKKYFASVNPRYLITSLKEKQEKLQEIIPKLEQLYKFKEIEKTKAEIFEGKEGIKIVLSDISNSGAKEFLRYGSSRITWDIIPFFMEKWTKERIKKGIKARYIFPDTKESRNKTKEHREAFKLVKYKFIPVDVESPLAIVTYLDRVVLVSAQKEKSFVVMIKNKDLANAQTEYFEKLWKIAKQ